LPEDVAAGYSEVRCLWVESQGAAYRKTSSSLTQAFVKELKVKERLRKHTHIPTNIVQLKYANN
jgi:hypothetical protein